MKSLVFVLLIFLGVPSFSQILVSPLSSGQVDLDQPSSGFIYFTNSSLTPASMSLSLSEPGFKIALDRCSGKTLAKNQSCYIFVAIENNLLIQSNNLASLKNNSIDLIDLKKTKSSVADSITFSQTSLSANDFLAHDLIVRNQSSSTKSFSFSFSGADASKYSIVTNRCINVPARGTCVVSVKLKAQVAGSYSASLSDVQISNSVVISSTISGSTSGVLANPTESILLSSSSLSFGSIKRFGISQALSFSVQNTGNSLIMPIILPSPKMAITLNRCLVLLAPGKSCSVSVAMNLPYPEENNDILGQYISVKSSVSATPTLISVSGSLNVPPITMLNSSPGGICPSNKHFEGALCSSNERVCSLLPSSQVDGAEIWSSGSWSSCQARSQSDCDSGYGYVSLTHSCDAILSYPKNCDEIREDNPSAVDDYYEVSLDGSMNHQSVYCDFDGPYAYMEIFNVDRENSLTDSDILAKLNAFTNNPISLSNIYRDPSGLGVALVNQYNTTTAFVYAMNKAEMNGLSITFYKKSNEPNSFEGGMAIYDHDVSGCAPDTSVLPNNCFNSIYKYQNQIVFSALDQNSGGGSPLWYLTTQVGVTAYDFQVNNYSVDLTPEYSYLATFGRVGSGRTLFYIKSLRIKGKYFEYPISCADAKIQGALNSDNNNSSGTYTLDLDGSLNGEAPTQIYCDMSSSGVAVITKSCYEAKLYGQKSSNNDHLSGMYSIDLDGVGTGAGAESNYCDMIGGAWDNYSGGYTLAGVFNNSSLSTANSLNITTSNTYLTNSYYQALLANSKKFILRSNRQDNTEVVFSMLTQNMGISNCYSNLSSASPTMPFGTGFMAWLWRENAGCNFSGADYTGIGIRNDGGIPDVFFAYALSSNVYITYWNWVNMQYEIIPSIYSVDKVPSESIYLFLK